MEQMPTNNQENNLDKQIESEKNRLGSNTEEVVDLVNTKKTPYTEKAKLLLAKAGKIGAIGFAAAGGVALLGSVGLSVDYLINDAMPSGEWGMRPPTEEAKFLFEAMSLSTFASALGILATSKLDDLVESIKSKIQALKN